MANGESFNRLFAQFTRLRKTGVTRERAWSQIEPHVLQLDQPQRDQLLALLRDWEADEGRGHQPPRQKNSFQARPTPTDGLVDVLGDLGSVPLSEPSGVRLQGIKRISNSEPGIQSQSQQQTNVCANCGTTNRPGEILCANCGQTLQEGLNHPGSTHRLATTNKQDSAFFGEQMTLALRVEGADHVIRVRPGKSELVIGRCSPESVMIPDVDLARYDAERKGVSRMHAALQRHDTTLVLTDMGSLNHTYINGQRVHAHEVRVMHDGDQLQFGQLRVNVYFEQA